MSLREAWNQHAGASASEYQIIDLPVPRVSPTSCSECRKICKQNICHCYGVTWGCPPGVGSVNDCAAAVSTFPKCAVICRTHPISIKDKESIDKCSSEMQDVLRAFNCDLRSHGYRTLALADDGCNYCKKCSYPEPCSQPNMMIPSMGGYGILIVDYLENHGIQVPFDENSVTIYCIVLYDDSHIY